MPTPLALLVGALAFLLAGDSAARWLPADRPEGRGERLGLSLLLGLGAVALALFLGSLARPGEVGAGWVVGTAAVLGLARHGPRGWRSSLGSAAARARETVQGIDRGDLGVALVLALVVALAAAVAFSTDLWSDGLAIYGLKARAAFVSGGLPRGLLHDGSREFSHHEYPWLLPLDEAALSFLGGEARPALAKGVFPVFFAALASLLYAGVARRGPRSVAVASVLALAALPSLLSLAGSGYADVPVGVFWFGSVLHLAEWLRSGARRDLVIAAVLVALAAWTKQEGLVYWALQAAAVFLSPLAGRGRREALRGLALFLAVSAPIVLPWLLFLAHERPTSHGFAPPSLALLAANRARLPVIAAFGAAETVAFSRWGLLWLLLPLALARHLASPGRAVAVYLAASIALPLAGFLGSCVFSLVEPFEIHLRTSTDRLFVQQAPAAVFLVATAWLDGRALTGSAGTRRS